MTLALDPGPVAFYRVVSGGRPLTPVASFKTAASPGSAFTVLAFGDSGSGSREQMDLARRMTADSWDFAIHTGDVIYPNGEAENYDARYFGPYGEMSRTRCVFPSIGNHDARNPRGYLDAFRPIRGTTYVLTGGGGKDPRGVGKRSWTAHSESEYHYVLFTVGPASITGRAVAIDGRTLDEFAVPENR